MVPRQWLVSCHRKRSSAEAHQSVSNSRAMPPNAAMAAATLGLAASAALEPRPPWSGTIRQATDQLVLATTSRASNARNIGVLCVSRQWLGSPSIGGRPFMEPQAAGPAQLPTSPPAGWRSSSRPPTRPARTKCWRPIRRAPTHRHIAILLFRATIRRVREGGARTAQGRPRRIERLAHVTRPLMRAWQVRGRRSWSRQRLQRMPPS